MKNVLLLAMCAALAGLAVKAAGDLSPGSPEAGKGWSSGPTHLQMAVEEEYRRADLELLSESVVRALAAKDEVAQLLYQERMTLIEAAGRLQEINEATLSFHWLVYRRTYPGQTDEERHCREAVTLLRGYLAAQGIAECEALTGLEAELEGYLAAESINHAPAPCP
jgi:hypothetical protein